jgi:hypothetical protein
VYDLCGDGLATCVRDAMPEVRDDVLGPPFEYPRGLEHRLHKIGAWGTLNTG